MSLLVLTAVRLLCQCWENVAALSLSFLCHQLANSLCNTSAQTCGRLTLCAMSAQPLGRVQAGTHIHKQFGWALQEKKEEVIQQSSGTIQLLFKDRPLFLKDCATHILQSLVTKQAKTILHYSQMLGKTREKQYKTYLRIVFFCRKKSFQNH